jgi:hypothetical protein
MAIRSTNKTEVPETVVETKEAFSAVPEEVETQVAVKEQAAPPAVQGTAMPSIAELENKWNPEEVGNLFPRIIGTNGALFSDGVSFGEWIDVQVYSHSSRLFITPVADQSDKDAKFYCRASYDGKTIPDRDGGDPMTIDEYAESISDTYEEVKRSTYHDVYCVILGADKNADKAAASNILQLSISPTSIKGFKAFMLQTKLAVLRGQMIPSHQNCLRVHAVPMSKNGQNYVMTSFSAIPLDVVKGYTPIPE